MMLLPLLTGFIQCFPLALRARNGLMYFYATLAIYRSHQRRLSGCDPAEVVLASEPDVVRIRTSHLGFLDKSAMDDDAFNER